MENPNFERQYSPAQQQQQQQPNIAEQVKQSLRDFSSPEQTGTTNEGFLQSNGIVANFAFLVLVLIAFLLLMNLGIYLMNYFLQPSNSPYIIKGTLNGDTFMDISRDPSTSKFVVLQHSNNRAGGIEFTWSVWLNFNDVTVINTEHQYSHIFSVGTNNFDETTGISMGNNGPGLYLRNKNEDDTIVTTANALLLMDTMSSLETNAGIPTPGTTTAHSTDITNLPYGKWFHMAIRMQNEGMDVYINGTISNRVVFNNVPKQNYQDILVCANGGFPGQLSNLRYYDYGLSVFEIMNIVYWGPNLKAATTTTVASNGDYNFLSSQWYNSKL
jgi:hypothetical protein